MNISKPKNSKKLYFFLAIILVLLSVFAIFLWYKGTQKSVSNTSEYTDTYNKVDYSPPTDSDKKYNDQIKEGLPKTPQQPSANERESVSIVIIDASQYDSNIEIRAFIEKIVESDGECTLRLTGPGTTTTKIVPAIADATSTRCTNTSIPSTDFDKKGQWKLTVSYNSQKSIGSSAEKIVEVK